VLGAETRMRRSKADQNNSKHGKDSIGKATKIDHPSRPGQDMHVDQIECHPAYALAGCRILIRGADKNRAQEEQA